MTLSTFASGQVATVAKNSSFAERLYVGGGFDLSIQPTFYVIGASPSLGVMLTKTSSIGTGITYKYLGDRLSSQGMHIYGYRFFARQNLFAQLFAYAEFESLSYELYINVPNSERYWESAFYMGGGWYQPITDKVGFAVIGLYNFRHRFSSNLSPWRFRAGFTYSLF